MSRGVEFPSVIPLLRERKNADINKRIAVSAYKRGRGRSIKILFNVLFFDPYSAICFSSYWAEGSSAISRVSTFAFNAGNIHKDR